MSIIEGVVVGAETGGFYPTEIEQSLRFNDDDSAYLSWTPASAGNRKTWTFSTWVKRGNLSTGYDLLFSAGLWSNSNQISYIGFDTSNHLEVGAGVYGVSTAYAIDTSAVFRDVSAWYHIVVATDTTQATASDRLKVYVNGVLQTLSGTIPTQNYDTAHSNTVEHNIGKAVGLTDELDGYLADVHFTDGTAYDATAFGEFKNGVWIPKTPSVTYGTNGFYLDYSNGASIGADSSGNSNNWTANSLASTDISLDSPTNNFATLNHLDKTGQVLSEGNLKFYNNDSSHKGVRGNFGMSTGKWYFECTMSSVAGGDQQQFGLARQNVSCPSNGSAGNTFMMYWSGGNPNNNYIYNDGTSGGYTAQSVAVGDVLRCAYDADTGKLWLGKNSDWYSGNGAVNASANPDTGTSPTMTLTESEPLVAWAHSYSNGGAFNIFNFGQDSSFAGNKTPQGYTDANGIGDFYYAPPAGYLALCTANLPEPAIGPNSATTADEHFNTVLSTSGGASGRTVTGVGFQPDLVWDKPRSNIDDHILGDIVRGIDKNLTTNKTAAEVTRTTFYTSFDSDGFTVGSGDFSSGKSMVSWAWKANGSGSTNTDGTITSTVAANVDAGFSIVSYTSNGSSNQTVGHGLSQPLDLLIVKNRDGANNWGVWHKDFTADQYLGLNGTNAVATFSSIWYQVPNSTTFGIGTLNTLPNYSGANHIAYCFHSVEGYSKVFSYTGNGSTDGPFQNLGLRPAWIMIKRTNYTSDWILWDAKRDAYNVMDSKLSPNTSGAEYTGSAVYIDALSNGFKLRNTDGSSNSNGDSYIGIAFAENPFKYSNAR